MSSSIYLDDDGNDIGEYDFDEDVDIVLDQDDERLFDDYEGESDGMHLNEDRLSDAMRKERTWALTEYMIRTLSKHRMKELMVIFKDYCEGRTEDGIEMSRDRLRSKVQNALGPHSTHFMKIFNRYWHGQDFVIDNHGGDYLNDEQFSRRTIVNAVRSTATHANLGRYTNSEIDDRVLDLYGYIYNMPSDIYRDLMRKLDTVDRPLRVEDFDHLNFRYKPLVDLIMWTLRLDSIDSRPDIPKRSIEEPMGDHNDSLRWTNYLLQSVERYLGPGFDQECLDELARTPDFKSNVVASRMVCSLPDVLLEEVVDGIKDFNMQYSLDSAKDLKPSAQNNFCKSMERILKYSAPSLFADICKNSARLNPTIIYDCKNRYIEALKDQRYCQTTFDIRAESHHVLPNSQYEIADDMGIGLYWQDLVKCYDDKSLPYAVTIEVPPPPELAPLPQHPGMTIFSTPDCKARTIV